jgi:hypothetical protein
MSDELTLGDVFEIIAEQLATARTKALMGERKAARGLFRRAFLEFTRFREVLRGYPGFYALEHSFEVTKAALCPEETALESEREAPARSLRRGVKLPARRMKQAA